LIRVNFTYWQFKKKIIFQKLHKKSQKHVM